MRLELQLQSNLPSHDSHQAQHLTLQVSPSSKWSLVLPSQQVFESQAFIPSSLQASEVATENLLNSFARLGVHASVSSFVQTCLQFSSVDIFLFSFRAVLLLVSLLQTFNLFCGLLQQILDNGCAYRINGDVYFSVDKFPEYGTLSGRKLEDNRAGERVAVDTRKKHPADFALWKVSICSYACEVSYYWLCHLLDFMHIFISFTFTLSPCQKIKKANNRKYRTPRNMKKRRLFTVYLPFKFYYFSCVVCSSSELHSFLIDTYVFLL